MTNIPPVQDLSEAIDKLIEDAVIGGTDDYPVINRASLIGDLTELLASPASPSPATGVRVKALEWTKLLLPVHGWAARTAFGDYRIARNHKGEFTFFREGALHSEGFPTPHDAKAAAQSHFDAAILSAIAGQP